MGMSKPFFGRFTSFSGTYCTGVCAAALAFVASSSRLGGSDQEIRLFYDREADAHSRLAANTGSVGFLPGCHQ
jgi:hypothetical protein